MEIYGKEAGWQFQEFYELVIPAIDRIEEGNDLVVTIDLLGFAKKDINLRIIGNVLYITSKREQAEPPGTVYYRHRPLKMIDKRVLLPISFKEEEEEKVEGKATYENGIVTLRVPSRNRQIFQ